MASSRTTAAAAPVTDVDTSGTDKVITHIETIEPEQRPRGADYGKTGESDVKGVKITATLEHPNPVAEMGRFASGINPVPVYIPVDPPKGVIDISACPDVSRMGTDYPDPRTMGANRASGAALTNPSQPVNLSGGMTNEETPAASQITGFPKMVPGEARELEVRKPSTAPVINDGSASNVTVPGQGFTLDDKAKRDATDV